MRRDYSARQEVNPEENVVKLRLDKVVVRGAQEILQKALEVEVGLFLERYQYHG